MSVFSRPVLIVDDSSVVRLVLGEMLGRFGFTDVLFASDAQEALALWEKEQPGIILLDITMPEVPGTRVATHILRDDPRAKIIVVSAVSRDAALVEAAISLGVYDYLRKPVRQADLEKVLERIRDEEEGAPAFSLRLTADERPSGSSGSSGPSASSGGPSSAEGDDAEPAAGDPTDGRPYP